MGTAETLEEAGFTRESVSAALEAGDFRELKHSGLLPLPNRPNPMQVAERAPKVTKRGRLAGYAGIVWIEGEAGGSTWKTETAWTGLFAVWKAKRYAQRNGITLTKGSQ